MLSLVALATSDAFRLGTAQYRRCSAVTMMASPTERGSWVNGKWVVKKPSGSIFVDEEAMLAKANFKLKPDELIEYASWELAQDCQTIPDHLQTY